MHHFKDTMKIVSELAARKFKELKKPIEVIDQKERSFTIVSDRFPNRLEKCI
jgi:hypothetical protein